MRLRRLLLGPDDGRPTALPLILALVAAVVALWWTDGLGHAPFVVVALAVVGGVVHVGVHALRHPREP